MSYNPSRTAAFALTPPVLGDFSWVNQGGATITQVGDTNYLYAPATAGVSLRQRVKSQPSPPYTIEAAFIPNIVADAAVFPGCGLQFRESGTSKIITHSYTTAGVPLTSPQKWTNSTTYSANYVPVWDQVNEYATGSMIWMQIRHITTHLQFWVSNEGRLWHQIYQDVVADFFTTGPDQVGFFVNTNTASYDAAMTLVHWKQS